MDQTNWYWLKYDGETIEEMLHLHDHNAFERVSDAIELANQNYSDGHNKQSYSVVDKDFKEVFRKERPSILARLFG